MNRHTTLLASLAVALIMLADVASADVAVIVHPSFEADSASVEEIKRLYLGKSSEVSGAKVTPIDQTNGTAPHDEFYKKCIGKTGSQIKAYWARLVFTGKSRPPKETGADSDVLAEVAADAEKIGYVDVTAVTGDVKVLLTIS